MLSFTLSGIGFRLHSDSARVMAAAHEIFGGYAGGNGEFELTYVESSPWDMPTPMQRTLVVEGGHVHLGGEFEGRVDWAARRAHFRVGATPELFPPGSLQNTLRVLLVQLLADRGGLLLHAASMLHAGRAWAFFGESGAGKSTLAKQFAHETLLGDEICSIDGSARAHRAPFTGETLPPPVPLSGLLGGLFAIEQGPALRISKVPPAEAMRLLLKCVVHTSYDRVLTDQLFDAAAKLTGRVYRAQLPLAAGDALRRELELLGG